MNATIEQLWDTCRNIISYDGSDTGRPTDFNELAKCDNVLMGNKLPHFGKQAREVLIGDNLEVVIPTTVHHPCGGTMYVLEVM